MYYSQYLFEIPKDPLKFQMQFTFKVGFICNFPKIPTGVFTHSQKFQDFPFLLICMFGNQLEFLGFPKNS